jgi:enolase
LVSQLAPHDDALRARVAAEPDITLDRVQIVGNDFLVTDAARLRRAAAMPACNAILVKPNQVGTVSEAMAAVEAARAVHWGAIWLSATGQSWS